MANKTKKTTKRKTRTGVSPGPSHRFDTNRFKNMVIVALIAFIVGISAACFAAIFTLKDRLITDEQQAYLKIFPELAASFARDLGSNDNLTINSERDATVKMTGYGISETDGAFYINFDFVYADEATPEAQFNFLADSDVYDATAPVYKGTVYFWEDQERPGHYSYAFSYEQ